MFTDCTKREEYDKINKNLSQPLMNYYTDLTYEMDRVIKKINKKNFFNSIIKLNKLDVCLRLYLFYINNPDFYFPLSDYEIIKIIKDDHQRFFFEEIECPNVSYIKQRSICFQIDTSKSPKNFLWDIDLKKILIKNKKNTTQNKKIIKYFNSLKNQAIKNLNRLSSETFNQVYPQIFIIDAKIQLLLETIFLSLSPIIESNELIKIIEKEAILAFEDKFLYKIPTDEKTIRFPFSFNQ
ncbi:TPA: hypothetical protein ACHU8X_002632 [Enterococcus faecalis]